MIQSSIDRISVIVTFLLANLLIYASASLYVWMKKRKRKEKKATKVKEAQIKEAASKLGPISTIDSSIVVIDPDKMTLNELAHSVWKTAQGKGFHDEPVPMSVSCSNLHGEISELWESYRRGTLNKPCDKAESMEALGLPVLTYAEEELADALIRVLDTAVENKVDISRAVAIKDAYNKSRPHMHNKRC